MRTGRFTIRLSLFQGEFCYEKIGTCLDKGPWTPRTGVPVVEIHEEKSPLFAGGPKMHRAVTEVLEMSS
jgi:hypothetical protein